MVFGHHVCRRNEASGPSPLIPSPRPGVTAAVECYRYSEKWRRRKREGLLRGTRKKQANTFLPVTVTRKEGACLPASLPPLRGPFLSLPCSE